MYTVSNLNLFSYEFSDETSQCDTVMVFCSSDMIVNQWIRRMDISRCWMSVIVLLVSSGHQQQVLAGRRRCTLDDYRAGAPKSGSICGSRIPEVLSLICNGIFLSPGKKSVDDLAKSGAEWDSPVFIPRQSASSFLRSKRNIAGSQFRTGIYCECCLHPCNIIEMSQYCGQPGERDKRSPLLTAAHQP
nr:IRP-5 [Urechis unicinctus]